MLTVKPPAASESSQGKKLFFGCNLLPVPAGSESDAPSKEKPRSYTLLATPLEGNEEPVVDSSAAEKSTMAMAEAPQERLAPAKTGAEPLPAVRVEECPLAAVNARDGNDSSVPAVVSRVPAKEVEGIEAIDQFEDEMEAFELAAGIKTAASPSMSVRDIRSPKVPALSPAPGPHRDRTPAPQPETSMPTANASGTRSGRRPSSMILLDSPKLRGEDKALAQASPKKTPSKTLASLQPPKPLARSTKAPTVAAFELPGEAVARRLKEQREARLASQWAQPQPVQDGGDKVAHRPGEKREARLSIQFAQAKPHSPNAKRASVLTTGIASPEREDDSDDRGIPDHVLEILMAKHNARPTPPARSAHRDPSKPTTEVRSENETMPDHVMENAMAKENTRLAPPTRNAQPDPTKSTSSLRRAKSMRAPTLPKFELPGEAISRRKREEQEARRKAEEEEERRRRQFKAKPIRSTAAPSTVPRGTVASRARLNGTVFEKPAQQASPTQNKRASVVMDTQPRGRHLTAATTDQVGPQVSRATSSSAGSTGKRSSVSLEEVQQQRVRGKDIFQRDSAFSQDRTKERRERETMARIAREEAAERSRQKSREWAEKQKRKRMTVGSMRDVAAT